MKLTLIIKKFQKPILFTKFLFKVSLKHFITSKLIPENISKISPVNGLSNILLVKDEVLTEHVQFANLVILSIPL